jgi:universal stress protein A
MTTIRKILVPTDFSPHADEAMRLASDLSRRYEAPLTLAYVYEPVSYALPDGLVMYTAPQLSELSARFDERLADAQKKAIDAGAVRVERRLLQGFIGNEITNLAAEGGFDLIVMGTHGRRGFQRLLLGSIAERVMRTAPCPVLTVGLPKTR